ncbi:hypothetical protein [Streptomyces sp. URMC 123]|uniref:hypothetical protein n=1 Tax=Streptomyces sp. URMC 123 TaxID=3423403 RepID=UPI003F19B717
MDLKEGVAGLADRRAARKRPEFGTVDIRVVEAMRQAIDEGVDPSTRTASYLIWRTKEILTQTEDEDGTETEDDETEDGQSGPQWPSRATLYRLVEKLTAGTHTLDSAVTRRSKAHVHLHVAAPPTFSISRDALWRRLPAPTMILPAQKTVVA